MTALDRTCGIEGCDRPLLCKAMCSYHYNNNYVHGNPLGNPPSPPRFCEIDGCERKHYARGVCHRHYQMWQKYGDPLAGARTPESQGEVCSVDTCEAQPRTRQMCGYHYQQWYKWTGDPEDFAFREPVQVCLECIAPIIDKPRHTLYCSARCADIAWRKSTNGIAHQYRRRNALAGVETRLVTERDIARLQDRQGGACCYCGEIRKLTVEHVIPIRREGRHAIGNLALACGHCNSSKSSRLLSEWKLWKIKQVESASAA